MESDKLEQINGISGDDIAAVLSEEKSPFKVIADKEWKEGGYGLRSEIQLTSQRSLTRLHMMLPNAMETMNVNYHDNRFDMYFRAQYKVTEELPVMFGGSSAPDMFHGEGTILYEQVVVSIDNALLPEEMQFEKVLLPQESSPQ
ncbi:hypothetical protein ACFL1B_00595 [Nanoarchaeota archaeon]